MATIFGTGLANSTVSLAPPWQKSLGGTEVHLVVDRITYGIDGGSNYSASCYTDCEVVVDLTFVSPTQINFVLPDELIVNQSRTIERSRVVLIRNGVRYDLANVLSGVGLVYLDPLNGDPINAGFVPFQVGYECLYSFSLTNPSACGISWSQGQNRDPIGAVTDASGRLITSQNPVHQGEAITLWATGLEGLSRNASTGLLQQSNPIAVGFGVARNGVDIPTTITSGFEGQYGAFWSKPAAWAGESPQFVGLDQINVAFPTCTEATKATVEKRYDAFMMLHSIVSGNPVRLYLPFVVNPGDPDCQWRAVTNTTFTSSVNPSPTGQPVVFVATVTPPTATGTVTFFDGSTPLTTVALNVSGGVSTATFTANNLSAGTHSITATYNGNACCEPSSSTRQQTVVPTATIALTSSPNPSIFRQTVNFTATVSPSNASGTVTFSELISCPLPCSVKSVALATVPLNTGKATLALSSLSGGSHLITAAYSGDSVYKSVTSSIFTQAVNEVVPSITLTVVPNPYIAAQPLTLTATLSPSDATGWVSFNHNGPGGTAGSLTCGGGYGISVSVTNGQARCDTNLGGVGSSSITASYGGDANYSSSTSAPFILTLKQPTGVILTSSANPAVVGQSVTFTAVEGNTNATGTITLLDSATTIGIVSLNNGQATFSTSGLAVGNHSIKAIYSGDSYYGESNSSILTQIVNAH
jgi:hypothetical protein